MFHADDSDNSAIISIIVGSTIGGLFIPIGCSTTIMIIAACVVYHTNKLGQRTTTTTNIAGGTTNQSRLQLLQNHGTVTLCDYWLFTSPD